MILNTLPPWLKGIINTRVAEATQHTRTAPILKEFWDFLEQRFHEYDPSRADERWRALIPRVVKGQVTLVDSEDFYARWQQLLPLSNETRPHVIWEQLLSKLPWMKEEMVGRHTSKACALSHRRVGYGCGCCSGWVWSLECGGYRRG